MTERDRRDRKDYRPIRLAFPGLRAGKAGNIAEGFLLVFLCLAGVMVGLPVQPSRPANVLPSSSDPTASSAVLDIRGLPLGVGASSLPDLSLPKTVVSSVTDLIDAGGVVQADSQNLTLYNAQVALRLLGGALPHDQLLAPGHVVLSYWSFWGVEANMSGLWVPLLPVSNNFTVIGTNRTGTYVVRNMRVTAGDYSGDLNIVYKATSAGPLKWDLQFEADYSAQYRLVYSWRNVPSLYSLLSGSGLFRVSYRSENYTFSWNDVPTTLATSARITAGQFVLTINLGRLSSGSSSRVDPSVVGGTNTPQATSTQSGIRRVFYEPKAGYYWVFYYVAPTGFMYSNSHDGVHWAAPQLTPIYPTYCNIYGCIDYLTPVFNSGQTVVLASGGINTYTGPSPYNVSATVNYSIGNITGSTISWGRVLVWDAPYRTCNNGNPGATCTVTVGIRYLNIMASSDGSLAVSYNWFSNGPGQGLCGSGISESAVVVKYKTQRLVTACVYGATNSGNDLIYQFSTVQPSDGVGGMRVIYHHRVSSSSPRQLLSLWLDGMNHTGSEETIDTNAGGYFSVVADSEYGIHLVFEGTANNVSYAYRSPYPSGTGWVPTLNIFKGAIYYPTLSIDLSTNDLYAFGIFVQNNSIIMLRKPLLQQWSDQSPVFPVSRRAYISNLGSNYASAGDSNSSRILLVWTEQNPGFCSCNVTFASIPIQTVWSPYSSPSDPWDGNGLAPYGQYFSNLGEYVSSSSGMLTVRQTDISVPGRGLGFEITRVYTEPQSFLSDAAYNFENYPWAPLGDGWQLSLPWMNNVQYPSYLHLWDGQGYRIPSAFWTSNTPFENHQGVSFRLIHSIGSLVILYTGSGTSYIFDPAHRLVAITDTAQNTILVNYDIYNRISNMTDTIGRTFQFCYSNGFLGSINQTSGNCSSNVVSVRGVVYRYTGQSLTSVFDPAGRLTSYQYQATNNLGIAPWLISRITYATRWYDNYSYTPFTLGSEAVAYRVSWQMVDASQSTPIRMFHYSFTQDAGDQVTNSTVATYDGTQLVSYTEYAFSFAGMSENITDAGHVFLRGIEQKFGVEGEVPKEIVLVSPTLGYTNYYRYDLWGNLIYSRETISSTNNSYHESFSDYYNDGLPAGFYSFAETCSEANSTRTDNNWNVTSGQWKVDNGGYSLTGMRGNESKIEVFHGDVAVQMTVRWVAGPWFEGYIAFRYQSNGNQYRVYLSAWDNTLRFDKVTGGVVQSLYRYSFTPVQNIDYAIRVESSGYTHSVYLNGLLKFQVTDQDSAMLTGRYIALGTSSSTSASNPVMIRFDNIYVQPLSSHFTDSFLTSPNGNVHDKPAGIAEIQNATGTSQTIETYYGYTTWGGLNQTRQLYNSTAGIRWLATTSTYDIYGNLLTMRDPMGNMTYYSYSSKYQSAYLTNETRILNPGSARITSLYGYNLTVGRRLWSVDPRGFNTTYRYDILGRLTRITYPSNLAYQAYSYNDTGNYVDITNENGWHTRQVYDGLGRLSTVERFNGNTFYSNETYTYNWQDKVLTQKGPLNNTTYTYSYDALGRITRTTNPDGNFTTQVYDDLQNIVNSTDEDGIDHYTYYDRLGHLLVVLEPANRLNNNFAQTTYRYDELGNLRSVRTSALQTTSYSYDDLNRLTRTVYPDATSESYAYDSDSNIIQKVDRNGTIITYSYDSLNRQISASYTGQTTKVLYTYDADGNVLGIASQNATVAYSYDSRNRVIGETYSVNGACAGPGCGGGGSVAEGTLITLENGTSVPVQNLQTGMRLLAYNVTTGQYAVSTITAMKVVETSNMLVIRTQDPLPLRLDNATAQKLWVKKSTGETGWLPVTELRVGDYLFNALRLHWTMVTQIDYASGPHVMYDIYTSAPYDYVANGYLDPPKVPTGPKSSTLISPSSGGGGSTPSGIAQDGYYFNYTYSGEQLQTIQFGQPLGYWIYYAYDSLGRVANVSQYGGSFGFYAKFAYYTNDKIKSIVYGNGLWANYTYDALARPVSIAVQSSTKSYMTLNYAYNKTGTVASVSGFTTNTKGTRINVIEQYRYDPLQRLSNATITSESTNSSWYQYDTVGNQVLRSMSGRVYNSSYYQANNQLLKTSYRTCNPNCVWTTSAVYSYDNDGNLITSNLTPPGGSTTHWTYSWDKAGYLVKTTNDNGVQGYYAYDGLGRKLESKEASSTTFYAYQGTETSFEQSASLAVTAYIYAAGLRIARVAVASSTSTTVSYFHEDALGSTRLVTDSSRTPSVLFSGTYQPYGQDNTASGSETYKFTGKPVSQTTGLYYYYHRWYDPSIGRFISQDPLAGDPSEPQSLNPYVYVADSPTSATDPTGLAVAGISSDVRMGGACPSFWSNPWGSFTCQLSRTPTPVADVVAGYDIAAWGLAECEEECGQLFRVGSGDTAGAITKAGTTSSAGDTITTTVTRVITETSGDTGIATVDLSNEISNSNDLVSTSRFWSTTERGGFDFEDTQIHHLLPRQFRAFFARAGITNIDEYTVQLDRGVHMVLHGRGGLYAESWNGLWKGFMINNPYAEQSDILEFLGIVLEDFGF